MSIRLRQKSFFFWILLTLCVLLTTSSVYALKQRRSEEPLPKRSFRIEEKVKLVDLPAEAKEVRIWIPTPPTDPYQQVSLKKIESPLPFERQKDALYGNPLFYFETTAPPALPLSFSLNYKITRLEQKAYPAPPNPYDPIFLKPRGLVILNDRIQKIADENIKGIHNPYLKARAHYEYVFNHMKYDKSGTGWGRGDALYACDVGKGNCTDFHSLFIALCRASGIPAEFKMGYPIPKAAQGKVEAKYHCWAEFFVDGKGWVPVDISEAWKQPEKKDYLFGHLDEDRVLLTTGREIVLSPPQQGAALNYLAGPYIEVDGQPFQNFEVERRFSNI